MGDGVYGLRGHVAGLVVVELEDILDHVTIPHVHVEANIVEEVVSLMDDVIIIVVLVR